jgi:hypothetical protein
MAEKTALQTSFARAESSLQNHLERRNGQAEWHRNIGRFSVSGSGANP